MQISTYLNEAEDVDFVTRTAIERDPNKRRVKPVEAQTSILDFDLEGESSDDSDFRIEDHAERSDDDDDDSLDSKGQAGDDDSSEDDEEDDSDGSDLEEYRTLNISNSNGLSIADVIEQANLQSGKNAQLNPLKVEDIQICCGCLGDQSDSLNEIIECDSCGITVHEACYGVSDSQSVTSTDSLSPTAPWFCEACKAGNKEPVCELCPNSGGIFKETDVGKWVHLICALYVPGVAFGEVDKLSSVTLFEMPYSKWGAKSCSLCQDERFARTGVCIGCDAGMCRTYFHVTCAQREGFLSETHSEEADQADPFYAHCRLHSDKTLVKKRKRNYMALQLRTHLRKLQFQTEGHSETPEQVRIQRKLEKSKLHYRDYKSLKPLPWVPTQKMPRLLTTSAAACRKLLRKAELMGIDTLALEMQETQAAALLDVRKKWHIPPAFTVEFIAYYLDRNDRLKSMKETLETLVEDNKSLLQEQQELRMKYDQCLKENAEETKKNIGLKQTIHKFHSAILSACPTKNLPNIDDLGKPKPPVAVRPPQQMMVPTAAALKMGVGFPLNSMSSGRILSSQVKQDPLLLNECGICRQRRDQHLLAKCDTCHLHYHLYCLNPPLSRLPKKSKLYGWQCSECDKTSGSEMELEVKTPRRSRVVRYSRDGGSETTPETAPDKLSTPKLKIKPLERSPELSHKKHSSSPSKHPDSTLDIPAESYQVSLVGDEINGHSKGKKRRREKHKSGRYSPDVGSSSREHKRKRKKKSFDVDFIETPHPRITIKIKPIPLPAGEVPSESNPQCFYVPSESNDAPPPSLPSRRAPSLSPPGRSSEKRSSRRHSVGAGSAAASREETIIIISDDNTCDVCQREGATTDSVKCDECNKNYHFACLDPPLKKTPKRRGYSWHCADCDPTDTE